MQTLVAAIKVAAVAAVVIAAPYATSARAEVGWTWEACSDPTHAYRLTNVDGGGLVCRDKIDTLYSWGPMVKIESMKDQNWTGRYYAKKPNGEILNKIFTFPSAYSTFGYGDYAIRFRLRKDAKFRYFPSNGYNGCEQLTPQEVNDTVVVRYFQFTDPSDQNRVKNGLDYILCGLGPVHSWSYGTPEHYQEMIRDRNWIDRNVQNYGLYELYIKYQNGQDILMPDRLDGYRFTEALWQERLGKNRALAPGDVKYNPSVPDKTPTAHFTTRWANYINPNAGNHPGPAPGPVASLTYRNFLNTKFRDNRGRTLWLNPNRQCSSRGITGVITQCSWEFRSPNDIVLTMATGAVRYYKAQDASNICFTGEGAPGAGCVGPMTRYN